MNKFFLSSCLLFAISLSVIAQPDPSDEAFEKAQKIKLEKEAIAQQKPYDWVEKPVLHKLTEEELKAPAVIIKDKRSIKYVIEEEGLFLYETIHKIAKVIEDQGIEAFNKVYVPISDDATFVELKARAISPSGKITELNKDNIREVENVQDIGNVKIFAIEGLEQNGEVEYLYTIKMGVRDPYGRETFQTSVPVKEATLEIISPSNLSFEAIGYNGFPEFTLKKGAEMDTLISTAKNLPPMFEETYSAYRANLMRADYKLCYNTNQFSKKRLYSWDMAAETFAGLIYSYTEDEAEQIQKVFKKIKLKKKRSDEDKAILIESYIKNNIALEQGSGADYTMVEKILVNKYANEVGMARLFGAFLKEAGINHQLVITSNRFNARFDPEFESWNNFTDLIFYLPDSYQYISPASIQYRYGPAPYQLAGNYGLFVNPETQAGDVNYIAFPTSKENVNNITAKVLFDDNFDARLNIRHGWTGYRAGEFRTFYKYQDMEFINQRVTSGMERSKITSSELFNKNMDDSPYPANKEFYVESTLEAPSLIEKAGKNYIFKLGEIIGGQVELYQENERQADIDMSHPIYYKRIIEFTIPKGYKLQGIEDVKIDEFMLIKGEKLNRFISDYKINGDKVTVTVDEFYDKINLPKDDYESFRKVINAAADFNKVVVVFEKE